LQEETGITRVADPWGGSFFMESLTASLEAAAEALVNEVEGLGGMTEALLAGELLLVIRYITSCLVTGSQPAWRLRKGSAAAE
jgi:methylmalonyl-CoA mutase N-terminal domain/subunit